MECKWRKNKIFEFIKTIPNDSEIYINCAAGISRSGAVGFVLNEYFNQDNYEHYERFKKVNMQIQPNPMVKRILHETIFGKIDYSTIFWTWHLIDKCYIKYCQ